MLAQKASFAQHSSIDKKLEKRNKLLILGTYPREIKATGISQMAHFGFNSENGKRGGSKLSFFKRRIIRKGS